MDLHYSSCEKHDAHWHTLTNGDKCPFCERESHAKIIQLANDRNGRYPRQYTLLNLKAPEPGIEVEFIDSDGEKGIVYLCECCQSEWRDPWLGSAMGMDVVMWRYSQGENK